MLPSNRHTDPTDVLDRAVRRGIITDTQAQAIRALGVEEERAPTPPARRTGPGAAPPVRAVPLPVRAGGRIPLLAEALGYVGAVLAVAGGSIAVQREWERMPAGARLGLLGGLAVLFLAGGAWIRPGAEPALRRLTALLWFLSLAAVAGFALVLFLPTLGMSGRDAGLWTSVVAFVDAAVLWSLRREALQLLGVSLSAVALAVAGMAAVDVLTPTWGGAAVWAIGAGLVAGAWSRRLRPADAALAYGIVFALFAPSLISPEHSWGLLLGVLTAVVVMGAGVWLHRTAMLVLGAVALFGYLFASVMRFLGDTIGGPAALGIGGLLLILLALAVVRLRGFTPPFGARSRRPTPKPPTTTPTP